MVAEERQPVDSVELFFDELARLREDMDRKLDGLSKQVGVISEYVIEARTLEKARDLASEIKELKLAVAAQKELNAEYRGQIKMLRWIAGATGFLVALLGLLQLLKLIPGR
jgi:hypothetical protein